MAARATHESEGVRRPRKSPSASAEGSRTGLTRAFVIEKELIKADEGAPRRGCATVCAARHPDRNEDRVLCAPDHGVAAIFDGIGGAAGGELASRAACGAMAINLARLPRHEDLHGRRRWLAAALKSAQDAIALSRRLHEDSGSQGTTALAAVLAANKILTACVGDSRGYRVRAGTLELLADEHEDTIPRPPMADALDRITCAEDLECAPKDLQWAFTHRNILSAALGDDLRAVVREHDVAAGDLIVLTSDGVHDNLTPVEIEAVIARRLGEDPQIIADALVGHAQQRSQDRNHFRSKDDDISCAVLRAP